MTVDFTDDEDEIVNEDARDSVSSVPRLQLGPIDASGDHTQIFSTPESSAIEDRLHAAKEKVAGNVYESYFAEMYKAMSHNDAEEFLQHGFPDDLTEYAKSMEDVSPSGDRGIVKKIVRPGSENEQQKAAKGKSVRFHYALWTEGQDEPFDASRLRRRVKRAVLGDGRLIGGIELALLTMSASERSSFILKPEFMFGRLGVPPYIPADATILADLELLGVDDDDDPIDRLEDNPLALTSLSLDEVKSYVLKKKHLAKQYFEKRKYGAACNRYGDAKHVMEEQEGRKAFADDAELRKLHCSVLSNMAICYIKLDRSEKAIRYCKRASDLIPGNVPLLYRWALALYNTKDYPEAFEKVKTALELCAHSHPDKGLLEELAAKIRSALVERKAEEKLLLTPDGFKAAGEKTDSAKDNLAMDDSEQLVVTEANVSLGFRKHVAELLREFDSQTTLRELPLEQKTYTLPQLRFIAHCAEELGFNVDHNEESGLVRVTRT